MFDLSFSEILVIGVVALLVLGPQKLPKVARMAGLWVRKARAQWYSVRAEFEREMEADELRETLRKQREALNEDLNAVRSAFDQEEHSIRQSLDDSISNVDSVDRSHLNENDIHTAQVKSIDKPAEKSS